MVQEVHLEDDNGGPEHACVLHESPADDNGGPEHACVLHESPARGSSEHVETGPSEFST